MTLRRRHHLSLRSLRRLATLFGASAIAGALSTSACTAGDGTGPSPEGTPDVEPAGCEETTPVVCEDALVSALNLQAGEVSPQDFTNDVGEESISVDVDATAGGLVADPRQSYLYARFTDSGLEKVAINDDEALDSAEWDIAFHRYIIRLNGGSSGPSCVKAVATGESFDAVTAAPTSGYQPDDQFTESCEFRADAEAEDPENEQDYGVVLAPYYDYVGCLQMTGEVFVVELASGQHVKLEVTHFYEDEAQQECNELGSNIPIGSANIQLRYAFLD